MPSPLRACRRCDALLSPEARFCQSYETTGVGEAEFRRSGCSLVARVYTPEEWQQVRQCISMNICAATRRPTGVCPSCSTALGCLSA
jgi:RNA polymerase subunit RPABC4/transcription elongation factor Spt4